MRHLEFNINHEVEIKLTERGRRYLAWRHDKWLREHPNVNLPYCAKQEDPDGWSRWQLWTLMETFGPDTHIGMDLLFETTIRIPV